MRITPDLSFTSGLAPERLRCFATSDAEPTPVEFVVLLVAYVMLTEDEEQDPFLNRMEHLVTFMAEVRQSR